MSPDEARMKPNAVVNAFVNEFVNLFRGLGDFEFDDGAKIVEHDRIDYSHNTLTKADSSAISARDMPWDLPSFQL